MVQLETWEKRIAEILESCDQVIKTGDLEVLREVAMKGQLSGAGILSRFEYENMPPWLRQIYASGGQHYYSVVGFIAHLWDDENNKPSFGVSVDLGAAGEPIEEAKCHLNSIRALSELLQDIIPPAYLETPASIPDQDLFDR
jgi:hypothetical protein